MLGFKLFSWEESIFVIALLLESLVKTRLNTLCTIWNAQHSVPSDIQVSHPQVTSKTRNTCVFLNQVWDIWISDKMLSSMVNRKLKIHHFSPLTLEKWLSYPGSGDNDANHEIMASLDITSSGTCLPTYTHQQKQYVLSFLLILEQNSKLTLKDLKTESIRKLSHFNSQWTKPLYQNILSHIIFFFTLLKGYRCN